MDSEFKDKLMNADAADGAARLEYERKLAEMLESPLTGVRKGGLIFAMIACIGMVVLFTVLAIRFRHGPMAMPILASLALGEVFALAGAIITGRILLRGTYRHRYDSTAQANLIWIFTVLMTTLFMMVDMSYQGSGMRMTIFALVFYIGAAVMLLRTVIEQAELRTREKLLELQYEMAEMKDAIKKTA